MTSEVVVATSGEVLAFPAGTREEVLRSLSEVDAYLEAYRQLKRMLTAQAVEMLRREQKEA